MPTYRLYSDDHYARTCATEVVATDDGWWALAETVFYPGGGGQPADTGTLLANRMSFPVRAVRRDADGLIWHHVGGQVPVGTRVRCMISWATRYSLMRHHALMHIVNSIAYRDYGGLITGTQLGIDRSRIDLCLDGFDRSRLALFETAVNDVIDRGLEIRSAVITETEFRARPELIRTRNVVPPIEDGRVKVVEITGFDTQACGGTHVHSTDEIGPAHIDGFTNKGRQNKRLYWKLVS